MRLKLPYEPLRRILPIVFAVVQALLAIFLLLPGLTPTFWTVSAVFGIGCLLPAIFGWEYRGVRMLVRFIGLAVISLLLAFFVLGLILDMSNGETVTNKTNAEILVFHLINICLFVQAAVALFIPTLAVAGLKNQKADIRLHWGLQTVLLVLAGCTLFAVPQSRIEPYLFHDINKTVFYWFQQGSESYTPFNSFRVTLIVYLITVCAGFITIYIRHPFGVKQIDRIIQKAKGGRTSQS